MRRLFPKCSLFDSIFLIALLVVALFQIWQRANVTAGGLLASTADALVLLAVVGTAAYAVLHAFLWASRRIARSYGVHLGPWGSDTALDSFIKALRRRLARSAGGGSPSARGRSQALFGAALGESGTRRNDAEALRQSAEAFRQSIASLRKSGKDWTRAQSNLAVTLLHLSRQEIGRQSLDEAAEALRDVAEALEKAQDLSDWVDVQFLLCAVLTRLGRLEEDAKTLTAAVAAGRAALAAEDNRAVPMAEARLQINLAEALVALGEREQDSERLEEALALARGSLQVIAEDGDGILDAEESLVWRSLQMGNLGSALRCLGELRQDDGLLREAAETFRTAVALETAKNAYDRALLQEELAGVLSALGAHEEALLASDAALSILTREAFPLDWAGATATRGACLAAADESPSALPTLRRVHDDLKAALALLDQADLSEPRRRCRRALDLVTAGLAAAGGRSPES